MEDEEDQRREASEEASQVVDDRKPALLAACGSPGARRPVTSSAVTTPAAGRVAIYRDEIVSIGESQEELAKILYRKYGSVEALICKIEEDGEPIQMPPDREILGFF